MRFETSQSLRLGQHMKLSPRMIQTMEILQMPLDQLEERIAQELETNPTLEVAEGDQGSAPQQTDAAAAIAAESDLAESAALGEDSRDARDALERDPTTDSADLRVDGLSGMEDFARLEAFEHDVPEVADNQYDQSVGASEGTGEGTASERERDRASLPSGSAGESGAAGERDVKLDAMAAAPARGLALVEQLRGQWALCDVEHKVRRLGELILQHIEDDGSLRTPLDTIAQHTIPTTDTDSVGSPPAPAVVDLERALRALQLMLDPPGVVARSAEECLILQLDALEGDELGRGFTAETFAHARTLVRSHLEDLTQNRLPKVAEKTSLSLAQITRVLALLRKLSLAPGRMLVEQSERPIVPDAIVEYDEVRDRYYAYLNERSLQSLRVNQEYALMAKDKAVPGKDREYLRANLGNAHWLLDAVRQRSVTVLRVVEKVIEHQRDFFDLGPQALRPLPMTQVAEELGIHVATVSRAVSEKYIATPRGTTLLRKFFSGGISTGAGEEKAWDAVKEALRETIDTEDKHKPWSDEALVEQLKARGIEIARRTIAKYREQLNIPSARMRKKF